MHTYEICLKIFQIWTYKSHYYQCYTVIMNKVKTNLRFTYLLQFALKLKVFFETAIQQSQLMRCCLLFHDWIPKICVCWSVCGVCFLLISLFGY